MSYWITENVLVGNVEFLSSEADCPVYYGTGIDVMPITLFSDDSSRTLYTTENGTGDAFAALQQGEGVSENAPDD